MFICLSSDPFIFLHRYRCWPVEVFISSSTPKQQELPVTTPRGGKKSPKESPEKKDKKNLTSGPDKKLGHYITFLDLSKLLYPGGKYITIICICLSFK